MSSAKEKVKLKKILFLVVGFLLELWIHGFISGKGVLFKNYGVSLSFDFFKAIVLNFIFVVVITVMVFLRKEWGLVLILIGGLVNLVDRFEYGYVRDYWNFFGVLVNNLND